MILLTGMSFLFEFVAYLSLAAVALALTANDTGPSPVSLTIVSPVFVDRTLMASAVFTAPAMEVAVRDVNAIYRDKFNLSLRLILSPRTAGCLSSIDNVRDVFAEYIFRGRRNNTDGRITAMIAPGCLESFEIAQSGRDFNLLTILTVATDARVLNQAVFGNVVMSSSLIIEYFIAPTLRLFEKYNWTTIYCVYDVAGSAGPGAVAIMNGLTKMIKDTAQYIVYLRGINPLGYQYEPLLADIREKARVIYVVGHALSVRKYMISAYHANMTNGDYVYITVSPFEYPNPDFGNYTWQNYDNDDMVARQAYQSVLLIQPVSTDSNTTRRNDFFKAAIDLTKIQYNYTYGRRLNIIETPSPFTISSYASVYMLAEILSETWPYSSTPGFVSASLAAKFYNRCFSTPLGQFCFDKNGQRRIELEVAQLSSVTGRMDKQIFLLDKYTLNLNATRTISWLPSKTWPVRNMPPCGFSAADYSCGDLDNLHYMVSWTAATSVCLFLLIVGAVAFTRQKVLNETRLYSHSWKIDITLMGKSNSVTLVRKSITYRPSFSDQNVTAIQQLQERRRTLRNITLAKHAYQ